MHAVREGGGLMGLPQLTPCNGCEKLWRPERLYVLGIPSDPPTISRLCPACFGGAVRMMIAAEDDGAEMAVRRLAGVKGALPVPENDSHVGSARDPEGDPRT